MIKNVVFDMGQVLIRWTPEHIVSHLELEERDARMIICELFRSVEWVRLDRGTISEEDAITSVCARLPHHLHESVYEIVTGWWKWPLVPVNGVAQLIEELKLSGYNIYLLSNASSRLHEYFDRIPGSQYFDGTIVSADLKILKPQQDIYHALYEKFGLLPEECVFVDDIPANIDGAMLTGMAGVVFHGDVTRLRQELRCLGITVSA